ncbi:hypothetical protein ABW19_dt0200726 [Dactylella cylindrospora]|nr:hypothetical protein ABW19_dt0200726 [Dactylella cylindrospora]
MVPMSTNILFGCHSISHLVVATLTVVLIAILFGLVYAILAILGTFLLLAAFTVGFILTPSYVLRRAKSRQIIHKYGDYTTRDLRQFRYNGQPCYRRLQIERTREEKLMQRELDRDSMRRRVALNRAWGYGYGAVRRKM